MKELAKKYYLEENRNCAEAILMAANEFYNLGLKDSDIKLVGGFGGGMGCGSTCGALCGAISAIGAKKIGNKAHETPNLANYTGKMLNTFNDEMGAILCSELKPIYIKDGVRCLSVVEKAAEQLEKVLAE